ncbi:hypothetical protein C8A05DRAFT_39809, partial [Staphylotrichum tortipilum]
IFGGGPYTSPKMLECIMTQGHKTIPQFLANPKIALVGVTDANIENRRSIEDIGITWALATGRCTAFAVKVVSTLSARAPAIIDSSSTITGGAFMLRDGDDARFSETDESWKVSQLTSKFERSGNVKSPVLKSSSSPIPKDKAMVICLKAVEATSWRAIHTLFRFIDMVRDIRDRTKKLAIQWAQPVRNSKGWPTATLITAMQGTGEDLKTCAMALVFDQMFIAATELWGNPKLVDPTE